MKTGGASRPQHAPAPHHHHAAPHQSQVAEHGGGGRHTAAASSSWRERSHGEEEGGGGGVRDDESIGSLGSFGDLVNDNEQDMYKQFLAYFGEGGEDCLFPDEQDDVDDEEYDPEDDPDGGEDNEDVRKFKVSQEELARLLEEAREQRSKSRHGFFGAPFGGKGRRGAGGGGGGKRAVMPYPGKVAPRPILPNTHIPARAIEAFHSAPLQPSQPLDHPQPIMAPTEPPPPPRPPPWTPDQITSFLSDGNRARIARQVAQHYQLCIQTLFLGVAAVPPGGMPSSEVLAAMTDTHEFLHQLRQERDMSQAFRREVSDNGTVRIRGGEVEENPEGRRLRPRHAEPRQWGNSCSMFDVPRLDAVEDIIAVLGQRNQRPVRSGAPTTPSRATATTTTVNTPSSSTTELTSGRSGAMEASTTTTASSPEAARGGGGAAAAAPAASSSPSQPTPGTAQGRRRSGDGTAASGTAGSKNDTDDAREDPRASVDDNVREILKDGALYEELLVGSEAKVQSLIRHCNKICTKPKGSGKKPLETFTPGEERLLLRGLKTYGQKSWDAIRDAYLPTKQTEAIRHHCFNRQLSTASKNIIQDYRVIRDCSKRFSLEEDKLLIAGVKHLGTKWAKIMKRYLPNRSRWELRYQYVKYIKAVLHGKDTLEALHQRLDAEDKHGPVRRRGRFARPRRDDARRRDDDDYYGDDNDWNQGGDDYDPYYDEESEFEEEDFPDSSGSDSDEDGEEAEGGGGRVYHQVPRPQAFPSTGRGGKSGNRRPGRVRSRARDEDYYYDSADEYEKEDVDSSDEEDDDDEEVIMDDDDSAASFEKEDVPTDDDDSDDEEEERERWGDRHHQGTPESMNRAQSLFPIISRGGTPQHHHHQSPHPHHHYATSSSASPGQHASSRGYHQDHSEGGEQAPLWSVQPSPATSRRQIWGDDMSGRGSMASRGQHHDRGGGGGGRLPRGTTHSPGPAPDPIPSKRGRRR